MDPRYQNYMRAVRKYDIQTAERQAVTRFRTQTENEKKQNLVRARAVKLASKYSEFQDPFTGEPDLSKIQNWLNGIDEQGEDAWVMMREYLDYKTSKGVDTKVTPQSEAEITAQMERAAASPNSVASASPATEENKPRLSEEDEEMSNIFADWQSPA